MSELPNRKSPRAVFHDYSAGDYLATICTKDKYHYFGEIRNEHMFLNELGKFADSHLAGLREQFPYIEIPVHIIMPNHVHAIICINPTEDCPLPERRSVLSVFVGFYKQTVTMFARRNNFQFGWQERYHDHIIRNNKDGNYIADYIATNVIRWTTDCFNSNKKAK